jgi:hypothetical protein
LKTPLERERDDLLAVIDLAESVLKQRGNIGTLIAANGPTIGQVITRVLTTGSMHAT